MFPSTDPHLRLDLHHRHAAELRQQIAVKRADREPDRRRRLFRRRPRPAPLRQASATVAQRSTSATVALRQASATVALRQATATATVAVRPAPFVAAALSCDGC